MKLNDKVKIIQENAPYNSYDKLGVITDIDYVVDDGRKEWWFLVQFDKVNDETPYESWFLKKHLKAVK